MPFFFFFCIPVPEFAGKWPIYLTKAYVGNGRGYHNSRNFSSVFSVEACCIEQPAGSRPKTNRDQKSTALLW